MNNAVEMQIVEAEEQLRQAMLASDVNALDTLLSSELIFTNHLGQVMSKQDDLAAHKSGLVEISELTPSEQQIRICGDAAIVSVRVRLSGRYGGTPSEGDFRFTRVWTLSPTGTWQVIAGHSGLVT